MRHKYPKILKNVAQDVRKYPKLYVEWIDAGCAEGWTAWDAIKRIDIPRCATIGFMLRESNQTLLYLAQGVSQENVHEVTMIPKAWIQKVKVIR